MNFYCTKATLSVLDNSISIATISSLRVTTLAFITHKTSWKNGQLANFTATFYEWFLWLCTHNSTGFFSFAQNQIPGIFQVISRCAELSQGFVIQWNCKIKSILIPKYQLSSRYFLTKAHWCFLKRQKNYRKHRILHTFYYAKCQLPTTICYNII